MILDNYKERYDRYPLPKGYATVSFIWGGIINACEMKYTDEIVNFFIHCAEDNALCTLVKYMGEEENLECQNVSWYAFDCMNKYHKK